MKVNRHRHIRVRFQGPDGETYSKTFTNMTARVFQHELDHLDGVTLLNGPSRLKRDMAIKKASKLGYRYDPITIRKSVEEAMMAEVAA
jgi:peptide deformylase